eukprot:NODE_66_length_23959_cov_0.323009.p1 type:complete len:949 gc:universal NODE_66_length_23959_cov_0.323009:4520-7366(+)
MVLQIGDTFLQNEILSVLVEIKGAEVLILRGKRVEWVNEKNVVNLGPKIENGNSFLEFGKLYKARSAYKQNEEDELSIEVGDLVQLLAPIDDGWALTRKIINNQVGFVKFEIMEVISKQHYAIMEYYQTQVDYIRDLQTIKDEFIQPLTQRKILQEKKLFQIIFGNICEVLDVEMIVLQELDALKLSNSLDITHICDLISSHINSYFVYISYGSNNQEQLKKLKEISQSHKIFKGFLDEKYKSNILKGLDLASYLIKPVQRICKLPLLLREMKQNTCIDIITSTMTKLEFLICVVNESARKPFSVIPSTMLADSFSELRQIDRVLLRTYDCRIFFKQSKKNVKIYVFNDVIYTQHKDLKKSYTFKLKECEIGNVPDSENNTLCVLEVSEDDLSKLFIIHFSNDKQKLDFIDILRRLCFLNIGEYSMDMIQKHYLISKATFSELDDGSLTLLEKDNEAVPLSAGSSISRRKSVLKTLSPVGLMEIEKQLLKNKTETEILKSEKIHTEKIILDLQLELEVIREKFAGLEDQNLKLKAQIETADSFKFEWAENDERDDKIEYLNCIIQQLRLEAELVSSSQSEVATSLEQEKTQNTMLSQHLNSLLDEIEDKEKQINKLRLTESVTNENCTKLQKLLETAQKQNNLLERENYEKLGVISTLHDDLESSLAQKTALYDSLNNEIRQNIELKDEVSRAENAQADIFAKMQTMEVQLNRQNELIENYKSNDNESIIRDLSTDNQQLNSILQQATIEVNSLNSIITSQTANQSEIIMQKESELEELKQTHRKSLSNLMNENNGKNILILQLEKELSNSQIKSQHYASEIRILNDLLTVLTKTNQERTDLKSFLDEKLELLKSQQVQQFGSSIVLLQKLNSDLNKINHQNSYLTATLSKYKFTTTLLLEWFEKILPPKLDKQELVRLIEYASDLINLYADIKDDNLILIEKLKLNQ